MDYMGLVYKARVEKLSWGGWKATLKSGESCEFSSYHNATAWALDRMGK